MTALGAHDAWPASVVQVYRSDATGRRLAKAFRRVLSTSAAVHLQDVPVDTNAVVYPPFWTQLIAAEAPDILVLWLGSEDVMGLRGFAGRVILSSTLLSPRQPGLSELARDIILTWPWALPGRELPRVYRLRSWLRSRGVEHRHERLQLNTYFALSVADHALTHLVDRYSRDYFIESVEHETENGLNPGVYPRLSLGPGQRFASKGCYLVRLAGSDITPVSEWITVGSRSDRTDTIR